MTSMTTAQIQEALAELERIAGNGAYDTWQRREARRGIKLYTAELTTRTS